MNTIDAITQEAEELADNLQCLVKESVCSPIDPGELSSLADELEDLSDRLRDEIEILNERKSAIFEINEACELVLAYQISSGPQRPETLKAAIVAVTGLGNEQHISADRYLSTMSYLVDFNNEKAIQELKRGITIIENTTE